MNDYYKLDDNKNVVPCTLAEWSDGFARHESRIVDKTTIGDTSISTVFLGIDHSFGHGPALLFESMTFGGKCDGMQERCSTWQEAKRQHEAMCEAVKKAGGE